jgi:hypothetical protein
MKNKSLQYVKALLPPDKVKPYEQEEKLLYCEDCKKVYEVFYVNGKMKEAHFKNMCSLHLQRKTCQKCLNKK